MARSANLFDVEHVAFGGLEAFNFRVKGSTQDGFQTIVDPEAEGKISIELRSTQQDDLADYESYASKVRFLIRPILEKYNKENSSKIRIFVEKFKKSHLKRSQIKSKHFYKFCELANKEMLHPNDWDHFYVFVKLSRKPVEEERLICLLIEQGFAIKSAEKIASVYGHLMRFKRCSASP